MWVAWLGVCTTALNTGLLMTPPSAEADNIRNVILLVHAPATLFPLLAVALIGFRKAPFAALAVVVATSLEKALEFVGQSLLIFPPEEIIGSVALGQIVVAIWDQLYFVLWVCNTVGAASAALLMYRVGPRGVRPYALVAGGSASLLTLVLLLGPDYVGFEIPPMPGVAYLIIFTTYRVAVAVFLSLFLASDRRISE